MNAPNIIAVIFDFDDTLTDDSTTKLLEAKGIDPREFWQEKMPGLVSDGWDQPLAYSHIAVVDHGITHKTVGKVHRIKSQVPRYRHADKLFRNAFAVARVRGLNQLVKLVWRWMCFWCHSKEAVIQRLFITAVWPGINRVFLVICCLCHLVGNVLMDEASGGYYSANYPSTSRPTIVISNEDYHPQH